MSGRVATAEVNTITVLEFSFQTLQQQVVKVIAAELIVAVAGKHFGDVALNADDRNVKGAAAKVVDHGGVVGSIAETVGEAGGSRLIEDPHHFQACQHSGLPGGVALGIGEIRRHGD